MKLHEIAQLIVACEAYIIHDGKVLMHKRAEDKKKFPGFWIGPGGHVEDGEGKSEWIKLEDLLKMEKVFPPSKYYFDHILNDKAGILYNASQWSDAQLVKVQSERIDVDN